ncbi:hypothetical protein EVAR_47739_1 [Eumeta japonica]|uniref:Uncharacterized protein n=1 Tax=Eumeta variegata TaxID=151549 RepID=A0A4C1VX87_EUMVA|nr:hypothetical protein EVAR_47739_1 [Eumeta japonica]
MWDHAVGYYPDSGPTFDTDSGFVFRSVATLRLGSELTLSSGYDTGPLRVLDFWIALESELGSALDFIRSLDLDHRSIKKRRCIVPLTKTATVKSAETDSLTIIAFSVISSHLLLQCRSIQSKNSKIKRQKL